MIRLEMEDKGTAMAGAFASRFATGLLIPLVAVSAPGWVAGALIGLLLSLPDAIVTKTYGPIIGVGVVGGALVGLAAGQWAA